jgi:hypothetical protein
MQTWLFIFFSKRRCIDYELRNRNQINEPHAQKLETAIDKKIFKGKEISTHINISKSLFLDAGTHKPKTVYRI